MHPAHPALRVAAALLLFGSAVHAQQDAPKPASESEQIQALLKRIAALEDRLGPQGGLDLSDEQLPSITQVNGSNPLSRPWYENIEISGFAAFSYLDTGSAGSRPYGGFFVQEASLFIDAQAWEDMYVHADVRIVPLGVGASYRMGLGEVYADLRNLWTSGDRSNSSVGLKAGRFYIPFGDEYVWTRAPDNPQLSNSASDAYGLTQGVQLYGSCDTVGWIAALSNGAENLAPGAHLAAAYNLKFWFDPSESVHLSASVMSNGATPATALDFGGSNLQPVGTDATSSAGVSPSTEIRAQLYELDARLRFGQPASLLLAFGQGQVDDALDSFDRSLTWFTVEPRYDFSGSVYADLRLSEIGTYDDAEGYRFDGKIIAEGNTTFGYDTKRFQRVSLGVGWRINPHALLKFEVGHDEFWLISSSPTANDDNRTYAGSQLVLSF